MLVWYLISSTVTFASLAIFSDRISITKTSAGVLIMAIVSFVIAGSMKERDAEGVNTVGLSDSERKAFGSTLSRFVIGAIPLYFPLTFFFSDGLRIILGLAVLIGSILSGAVSFRVSCGDGIRARQESEKRELEETKKREENGRI